METADFRQVKGHAYAWPFNVGPISQATAPGISDPYGNGVLTGE